MRSSLAMLAWLTATLANDLKDERYKRRSTVKSATTEACNTIAIMECKLWLCRIFDLVMTMRLDIRLSLLLNQ